ncbi:hypothetical protein LCGC14_1273550 [marine sediment metagenome]|uniref:Histidinol phosphatase n=2 Tax=root TaxID=1 RepID=A0A831R3V2_9GAMM|nr:DUF6282 family protein [Marinobacter antarcticus]HEA53508.1 histidinol phosphatase [Marinobacter antarcticus]
MKTLKETVTPTRVVCRSLVATVLALCSFATQAQVAANEENPLEGTIDFHVHTAPDVSSRSVNDVELAQLAARSGMRAVVLKNHATMTADRAGVVQQLVPGIKVFGGIALNRPVGGLNVDAVNAMASMSGSRGKVVWLPTRDAAYNRATFDNKDDGISVASGGKVSAEMEAVLQAIKEHDLILATGHVSPEEVLAVVRRAREMGISKIVITHAMSEVPGLNIEQLKEVAGMGALLELVYLDHLRTPTAHLNWLRDWEPLSIGQMAAAVKEVGSEHFILASDLGQTGNPIPPDGMLQMIEGMRAAGVSKADIDIMARTNPAQLLGLD